MPRLSIDIWSDIACPWCYVGKRRLEQALGQFEHAGSVEVTWRSFELNPAAPRTSEPVPHVERLAKKYGMSLREAEQRTAHLVELARADGITLDFARIRPGNSFDAHRVLHLAAEQGLQNALKERLLRGYLSEGAAIGEAAVVARLATEVGLDAERVQSVLDGSEFSEVVREDEAEAGRLGIHGVPFFVFGGRYAVSGAQPMELLLRALRQAWDETAAREAAPEAELEEGAACGPDGC